MKDRGSQPASFYHEHDQQDTKLGLNTLTPLLSNAQSVGKEEPLNKQILGFYSGGSNKKAKKDSVLLASLNLDANNGVIGTSEPLSHVDTPKLSIANVLQALPSIENQKRIDAVKQLLPIFWLQTTESQKRIEVFKQAHKAQAYLHALNKIPLIPWLQPSSTTAMQKLIEAFEKAEVVEEYTDLAERIFDLFTKDDQPLFTQLHSLFDVTKEDHKKACILQLLGDLSDNDSLPLFLKVIEQFCQNEVLTKPTLTQIAAITYIRLVKLPNDNKEQLIKMIIEKVERYVDIEEFDKKSIFIGGTILTIRALGNWINSYQFLLKCLNYNDIGIIILTLEVIRSVWVTSKKNSKQDIESYTTTLCEKLQDMLQEYQFKPKLIEQILLTIEVIAPTLLSTFLPKYLVASINNKSTGLTTTIISIFKKLPRKLRKEILITFLQNSLVSTETMSKLLYFTLVEY